MSYAPSYSYGEVSWGETLCATRCGKTADGLLDDLPLCMDCLTVHLERIGAVEIAGRAIADRLGPMWSRYEERGQR